jgi:hypothetical protein
MNSSIVLIIGVLISGVVLLGLLNLVTKTPPELDRAHFKDAWLKIYHKSQVEQTWALAVLDADKLLDSALRKKGFKGETMAERLVSAKDTLSKRQHVWEAHKYRNQLAHEDNVKITHERVMHALTGFRAALKDLGAL